MNQKIVQTLCVLALFLSGLKPALAAFPEDLMSQPALRFYMDLTPGLGHQSHTAVLMRRLREAGYRGRMDVVFFHDSVNEKLGMLFPTYNPNGDKFTQYDEKNNIRFFHFRYSPSTVGVPVDQLPPMMGHVKYALSGGNDRLMAKWDGFLQNRLVADYLITINPPGWANDSHILFSSGGIAEMKDLRTSSTRESDFLWDENEIDTALIRQLETLQKTTTVIPAYPSSAKIDLMMNRLLGALASDRIQAQTFVVPVVGQINEAFLERFRVRNARLADRFAWTNFSNIRPGKINFIAIDKLSPPTFSHVFTKMNAPIVILSGRNSVNIGIRAGQPFLASEKPNPAHFSVLDIDKENQWAELRDAQQALLDETIDIGPLVNYFVEAFAQDSQQRDFYRRLSLATVDKSPEDHLELGLKEAFEIIRREQSGAVCSEIVMPTKSTLPAWQ